MTYAKLPSLNQWHKDSSVTFAVRGNDIILRRIDELLDHYYRTNDESRRLVFLTDLYMTVDYWLKIYKDNASMEKGRLPAIQALHAVAAASLCKAVGCTLNGLPRELELMWGRELSQVGVQRDLMLRQAEYITRIEAKQYRLLFKHGKAYMLPWFDKSAPPKPVLAESKHAFDHDAFLKTAWKDGALPNKDYGFFVLTMSRDLYMARHRAVARNQATGDIEPGFYHSSYVAGDPIACSGTMLIQRGVVSRIRFDSGHYMPTANNYRALVMALRMWNVPLKGVVFEDCHGYLLGTDTKKRVQDPRVGTVDIVLSMTSDMFTLLANRNATLDQNQHVYATERPRPNPNPNVTSPDPRSWYGNRPFQPDVRPPVVKAFAIE